MVDPILAGLGYAAAELAQRNKVEMHIRLKDRRVLKGLYDSLFKTVTVGGATFPDSACTLWIKLFYGSDIVAIVRRKA